MTKRGSLRKQLTEHLFEAILHGDLHPGERIVEGKLAKELGVGQSTLREALQELEHRGLCTKNENRGTFVTKLTTKDVEGIYAVRLELEPLAAVLAHQRLSAEHAAKLARSLERMGSAREHRDLTEMLKSDLAFHQLIWKLSDNSTLERALNLVCAPLFAFYLIRFSGDGFSRDFSRYSSDFRADAKEHYQLLAALKEGGPEHVRKTFREILTIFRARHIEHVQSIEERVALVSDNQEGISVPES
jgi:DNA-binding GntR family transcriptional regulator